MGETRVLNETLLRETMEHIKANPQKWKQSVWFVHKDPVTNKVVGSETVIDVEEVNSCGSAFCFAGHAALKSGISAPPKTNGWYWRDDSSGQTVDVFAQDKLGINYEQADVLFSASNTLEDLEKLVDAIIEYPNISARSLEELTSWYDEDDWDDWDEEDDDEDEDDDSVF